MKRMLPLLLSAVALAVLGGCAIAPGYGYNGAGRGGYYYGEDAYGGAGTVIYDNGGYYGGYYDPWGYRGYGSRAGTTIYYYDARGHRHYRPHRDHHRRSHDTRRPSTSRPRGDWDGRGKWHKPEAWRGDTGTRGNRSHPQRQSHPRRVDPSPKSASPHRARGRATPKKLQPDRRRDHDRSGQ
jgi:hypothetical protein